ncbi:MAG: OmpA family protein [Pseudomonadota bacterium]
MLSKPLGAVVGLAFGLTVLSAPLAAQDSLRIFEDQWYVSPMVSFVLDDPSELDQNGFGGSFGFGRGVSENWLMELNWAGNYIDRAINEEEQWSVNVDFLRQFGGSSSIQPYWLFGAGYLKSAIQEGTIDGQPAPFEVDPANFQTSIGFGIMTPRGDTNLRWRWELRGRVDHRDSRENDLFLNFGLFIPQKRPVVVAAADLDSDQDGVPNSIDECPGTPLNTPVDSKGCPNDSDGDGVVDGRDKCPGTPRGTVVDADGCPMDGDRDGVLDQDDDCLNTPEGAKVDVRGCMLEARIRLPDLEFASSSAELNPASTGKLDEAIAALSQYPGINIEVAGHTDSTGPVWYNNQLSADRANSVRQYLIDGGIAADRISATGYGPSQPIGDNNTEEGKQANRRVTLRLSE